MKLDDKELISGCINGRRQAQEALYKKFSGQMYVVSLRYAKEQQVAEDILQEAFIKVFNQIKNFRGDSSLGYWIKRIVVNTALNAQRSKLYLYPMVDVDEMNEDLEPQMELSDYSMDDLLKMINKLPTSCQMIFNLYAIEGYKHHEIADMLDINVGTSKSQYSRAKQLLREQLNDLSTKYGRG